MVSYYQPLKLDGGVLRTYSPTPYLRPLMDILLKGVTIIDPSSPFHRQATDVFIQQGYIAGIGIIERDADKIVSFAGLHISPGFTDVFSHFCDPGFEADETLESGAVAASSGGYTDVLVIPNTDPVLHHKSGIDYILQRSIGLPVRLHPIGALTKNAEGKELAEMYDMCLSGAVAFSDGTRSLQSSGVMVKALQYLKAIGKPIIQVPNDTSFAAHGLMNEGIVSTRMGLAGLPAVAEELMIARDIELVNYSGSKLHITGVSTAKGIDLIRQAKAVGAAVSCSVTPYHLYFTDEDLAGYDTNLKLLPPLRTAQDRDSLRAAVLDGTVDCIASHHLPQHSDQKMVEFEYAKNGMTALETCFAAVRTSLPHLPLEQLLSLFSTNPRKLFDLSPVSLQVGQRAALSLFLPDERWTPTSFASRSKNSAFIGKELTGKPVGIINKDQLILTA